MTFRPALMFLLIPGMLLNGCATHSAREPTSVTQGKTRQALHTDLVRVMLDQKRDYAAMANLQALEREGRASPEVQLLHADTQARLGDHDDARRRYEQLLDGPKDTDARHGLGKLLIQNDFPASLRYLSQAVEGRPTDAQFRNDFGYALMLGGCQVQALQQISTAQQLEPKNPVFRNNALLSLLIAGHNTEFQLRSQAWQLSESSIDSLHQQAKSWPQRVAAQRSQQGDANTQCQDPTIATHRSTPSSKLES